MTTRLGDLLVRVEGGKSFGSAARPAGPDEWGIVKVSAMTWGKFRPTENKVVSEPDRIDPRYEIRPNDVLVSRANTVEYVGAPVLVRGTRPRLLLSDKSLRLVPKVGVHPAYLAAMLSAPQARRRISELATGTKDSMRNISQAALLMVAMPKLPALDEQRRVVNILEDHLSRLDAADEYLDAAIRRASRLRESFLAQAIKAAVDGSPSLPIGELIEQGRKVAYGVLVPGPHVDSGVPLVRVGDIHDGWVDTANLKRVAPEVSARFPRTVLAGGEVLLSVVGTIGRVGVAPATLAGSNVARAVAVLPFGSRVNATYAALMLQAPTTTRSLNGLAHEVARKTLNLEDVRQVRIPVPDRQTQTRLASELNEKVELTRRTAFDVQREVLRTAKLRRALLHAAFSGRLTPRTSEDELERMASA